jgi:hypothetical protein
MMAAGKIAHDALLRDMPIAELATLDGGRQVLPIANHPRRNRPACLRVAGEEFLW